jgi:hypothetical protein
LKAFVMRRFNVTLAFSGFFGLFCMTGTGHAENFFEAIFGHFSQGESQNPPAQARSAHSPGRNGAHPIAHRSAARPVLAIKSLGCEGANPASNGVTPKGASESASRKAPSTMTDAAITAALCKDPTLQAGDAFMTSNGLRIIEGATDSRIVPVEESRIDERFKARLAEFFEKPAPSSGATVNPKQPPSRRAAAELARSPGSESKKPRADRLIRTSDGKVIRLVGGYESST